MLHYYPTNGERGEICVEYRGYLIGFIANLGRVDGWAADDLRLELIGDEFGSRDRLRRLACTAVRAKKKAPMRKILRNEALGACEAAMRPRCQKSRRRSPATKRPRRSEARSPLPAVAGRAVGLRCPVPAHQAKASQAEAENCKRCWFWNRRVRC